LSGKAITNDRNTTSIRGTSRKKDKKNGPKKREKKRLGKKGQKRCHSL